MTDQKHISDQVRETLIENGFGTSDETLYTKTIAGMAEAGAVSNGTRYVMLTLCDRGRYFSRIDGWGNVMKDVDLRDFSNNAKGAINAVLGKEVIQ